VTRLNEPVAHKLRLALFLTNANPFRNITAQHRSVARTTAATMIFTICSVGSASAQNGLCPRTSEVCRSVINWLPKNERPFWGCFSKAIFDETFMEYVAENSDEPTRKRAERDFRAAIKNGDCLFLKTGEHVVIMRENPPYYLDIQLRREGVDVRSFWTIDQAVHRPVA
jgi:hypothetical protein